jgi:hypothetical protein
MCLSFNGRGPHKDIDIVHMDYCAESVYSLLCNIAESDTLRHFVLTTRGIYKTLAHIY